MKFYDKLQFTTEQARKELFAIPFMQAGVAGNITLESYVAFLTQAYHHVKHTTPLLMAVGARIPSEQEWLRDAIAHYIEEELGHQEWILNDIEACGYDAEKVRHGQPAMATELMVAYAYDTINRNNPLGFFGMVQVLEGTSIAAASTAADHIRENLDLPKEAFSYLYSHGALDLEHIDFFESLMNRIESEDDQQAIIHCASVFYKLYGDIFRTLHLEYLEEPKHAVAR
jgi:pyrroloquinoline quinone (PQQ) biosynthesis protein C